MIKLYGKIGLSLIVLLLVFSNCEAEDNFNALRKKAVQGDADAQVQLGDMYKDGQGVEQNYTEAMKWFKLAADQGDTDAQFSIGLLYFMGEGLQQNYALAAQWFQKAADQGHIDAMVNTGGTYKDGKGVAKDKVKAFAYWTAALTLNDDKDANFNMLGILPEMTVEEIRDARQQAKEILDHCCPEWSKKASQVIINTN